METRKFSINPDGHQMPSGPVLSTTGDKKMLNANTPIAVHALVAKRWGGLYLRSHHATEGEARSVLSKSIDIHPLRVMPATVVMAANGNVRIWKSTQ